MKMKRMIGGAWFIQLTTDRRVWYGKGRAGVISAPGKEKTAMNLRGVFTAIVTPFCSDGSLDELALRALIDEQLQNGVAGIVPVL